MLGTLVSTSWLKLQADNLEILGLQDGGYSQEERLPLEEVKDHPEEKEGWGRLP